MKRKKLNKKVVGYRGGVSCKGQGERVLRASWGIFRKKKEDFFDIANGGEEKKKVFCSYEETILREIPAEST